MGQPLTRMTMMGRMYSGEWDHREVEDDDLGMTSMRRQNS